MSKILVIEYEEHLLEAILDALQQEGFETLGALDGTVATELIHSFQPNLVVSEIHLPELDGYSILQNLRSNPDMASVSFIFLTAVTNRAAMRKAMELGADDFITKPFTHEELINSIHARLQRQLWRTELQQSLADVTRSDQLKTDMIQVAAHDMRNPINAIGLALKVLRRKHGVDFLEEGFGELNDIAVAANRLQTITEDILSLERIEATVRNETLQVVDLTNLVEASYLAYRGQANQKGLAYQFEVNSHSAFVLADPVQLREAIHNLIVNAIKYTPAGGRVLLRLDRAGRICRLTIEDSGCGIPSDQISRLFRPFSRAQIPETQAIEGSGLGLHLVKKIVERYNGEVLVQSVYGEGSIFGFYLPMHEITPQPTEVHERKNTRQGLVRRLIGKLATI